MSGNESLATICVRTRMAGFHSWPEAPDKLKYLRNVHRHVFHIEASMQVTHDEREVEFHLLIDDIEEWWRLQAITSESCEMIARRLATYLSMRYSREARVAVFEDGECGASVSVDYKGSP